MEAADLATHHLTTTLLLLLASPEWELLALELAIRPTPTPAAQPLHRRVRVRALAAVELSSSPAYVQVTLTAHLVAVASTVVNVQVPSSRKNEMEVVDSATRLPTTTQQSLLASLAQHQLALQAAARQAHPLGLLALAQTRPPALVAPQAAALAALRHLRRATAMELNSSPVPATAMLTVLRAAVDSTVASVLVR